MEYRGPTPGDLANIHALNRFFLKSVCASGRSERFAILGAERMTEAEIARLASAPFLLFSFRERDEEFWRRALGDDVQMDLIDVATSANEKIQQLQVAGLGFLWQLARRNPYVARIVSGASVAWCERLGEQTLVRLLQRVAMRGDLTRIRFGDNKDIWRRLLSNGIGSGYQARLASQHCALQAMLTHVDAAPHRRLSAAACTVSAPGQLKTARPDEVAGIRKV